MNRTQLNKIIRVRLLKEYDKTVSIKNLTGHITTYKNLKENINISTKDVYSKILNNFSDFYIFISNVRK